ncbi:MAG: HNH endonuclease [Pirellulales bacterium]|nr:HNH endonuclease [Pirellulales bacterium]
MSRRTRIAIFERDEYRCRYCGRDVLADFHSFATCVLDHVKPRSAGGGNEPENLAVACGSCDRIKAGISVESVDEAQAALEERRGVKQRVYQHILRRVGRIGGTS